MFGWTMSAGSSRLLVNMITNNISRMNMGLFSLNRF